MAKSKSYVALEDFRLAKQALDTFIEAFDMFLVDLSDLGIEADFAADATLEKLKEAGDKRQALMRRFDVITAYKINRDLPL